MKTSKITLFLAIFSLILSVATAKPAAKPQPKKVIIHREPVKKPGTVVKKAIKKQKVEKKTARVTNYLKTGAPMANGKFPEEGYVAVSDRGIKKGSHVWIGYKRYIVGDYTAKWVHEKFKKEGYDLTVDVYTTKSKKQALEFGAQKERIALWRKA